MVVIRKIFLTCAILAALFLYFGHEFLVFDIIGGLFAYLAVACIVTMLMHLLPKDFETGPKDSE